MELLNEFSPTGSVKLGYNQPVLLAGSCFSSHIADHLRLVGFSVLNNPFGTVFHPLPLSRFFAELCAGPEAERILQREDVFLSYDAGSEVYGMSAPDLQQELETRRTAFRTQLAEARVLIITFGSAHGYRLKTTGEIAANCHKQPGSRFEKELTPLDELYHSWKETLTLLQQQFPQLRVIFTVSPVRYLRDGWVENNRSKARLTELTQALCSAFGADYFPAYEVINDALRDYRYFEKDGAHPNKLAVDAVWELFRSWYFDAESRRVSDEVLAFRAMEGHRLLFPESAASARFLEQVNEKREQLRSLYPYVLL